MRAGRLRQKLLIKTTTESRTGTGAITDSWATFATVWGSVEPISSKEIFAADHLRGEITVKIIIRYLAGVTSKMQIVHGSTTYQIESPPINWSVRNRELALMCSVVE